MSRITLSPNLSGSATFIIAAPATSTNRTLTLPDASGTLTVQGTTIADGGVKTASLTAVDYLSVIPAWAKRITVMVSGLSAALQILPIIRIGSGGSVAVAGYASQACVVPIPTSSTGAASRENSFLQMPLAATPVSFVCNLVKLTGNTWLASGNGANGTNSTTSAFGKITLGGVLDSLRITTDSGEPLTGGTINIMWEG